MIDPGRRQRFGQRDPQAVIARNVVLDRIKQHRPDIGRCWLQEVAEEVYVMLDIGQLARSGYPSEDSRHAADYAGVLLKAVPSLTLVTVSPAPDGVSHPAPELANEIVCRCFFWFWFYRAGSGLH